MRRASLIFITLFIFLAALTQNITAKRRVSKVDYYVSVKGDDTNPGSINKPFRTQLYFLDGN